MDFKSDSYTRLDLTKIYTPLIHIDKFVVFAKNFPYKLGKLVII